MGLRPIAQRLLVAVGALAAVVAGEDRLGVLAQLIATVAAMVVPALLVLPSKKIFDLYKSVLGIGQNPMPNAGA